MDRALDHAFYRRPDVVEVARTLRGMVISTHIDGQRTSGIITAAEAYAGVNDRASHACGGRHSARTGPMYMAGGIAYDYLCYGIHHLFNVVTDQAGIPHAVLVRGILPLAGLAIMRARRGGARSSMAGPGTAAQALGIHVKHSGTDLISGPIRIVDRGIRIPGSCIMRGPRIGVEYAGADALLPYHFRIAPSHPLPAAQPTTRTE